ncbi:hypothetical protein PSR1_02228 [Anaeromyxobacter sp. PSR-1]|nr:hypothetical protein PSR1_02228 [Anaeromyxobacter sp. PSR-1]
MVCSDVRQSVGANDWMYGSCVNNVASAIESSARLSCRVPRPTVPGTSVASGYHS